MTITRQPSNEMKKTATLTLTIAALAVLSATGKPDPTDNWGALTKYAIQELDFDQGPHSSDPSGDGHGPGTVDEPRVGLANIVERGSLDLTLAFLADALGL